MRSIPLPTIDDSSVFGKITASKRGTRKSLLKTLEGTIASAYLEYDSHAPNLESITDLRLTPEEREALLHAYSVETIPMRELREDLTSPINCVRCPLCGVGESSTLDHFLPKERTPQFSVYSKNLIPSCGKCNTLKNDLFVDSNTGARHFLHAYYDRIPTASFLHLDAKFDHSTILLSYSVHHVLGLDKATFDRLSSHFRLLRLSDRYRRMALEFLRGEGRSFERCYGKHKDSARLAQELAEKAEDWEATYGPNHWLVVLYEKLSKWREFCEGGFRLLSKLH